MEALATPPPVQVSNRAFARHFIEMIVAMMVGMAVFGAAVSAIFALLGCSDLLHHVSLRATVMAIDMTLGMVVWMRYRGHAWPPVGEMAAAMLVPLVLLIGPFEAGLVSGGALLSGMHLLMLPAMFIVMLRRRDEYSHVHHRRSVHAS
jgi:hypothetical protein